MGLKLNNGLSKCNCKKGGVLASCYNGSDQGSIYCLFCKVIFEKNLLRLR